MINTEETIKYEHINKALDFYNIDKKYKEECYRCIEEINNNDNFSTVFSRVHKMLFYSDFEEIKELWKIQDIKELFVDNINPFITNIVILSGFEIHKSNMHKHNFDKEQVNIHKNRVRECFENDLKNRGYKGIRISQMLWAVYFIRTRIIEIGRLQFEYDSSDESESVIKIHIPRGDKLDTASVKKSINDSNSILEKTFKIGNLKYKCNSWLLSNQIYEIVDKDTNISRFHELFDIIDGEDCTSDILNFVYETDVCDDYSRLPENTALQKQIKEQLLKGKKFYIGIGTLKNHSGL